MDKRRRARVQGGWAAPSNPQTTKEQPSGVGRSATVGARVVPIQHTDGCKPVKNVRSDRDRKPMPVGPAWLGKNIDQVVPKTTFVFEEPEEEIKLKPSDQLITLRYFPQFLDSVRSDAIFAELFHEIPWRQRYDIHNGVQAIQPRLTHWYSELPYTYSGVTVEANTSEWPKSLKELKEQLAELTGIEFNSLAANLYRDGHDSIGWHSDDEPIMGKTPVIASLSFGDERVFELRKKPPPNKSGERDYTYSQVIRLSLTSGSLLIMEGWTQTDWQHRVPKEYHDRGARINVTFRVAKPVHYNN